MSSHPPQYVRAHRNWECAGVLYEKEARKVINIWVLQLSAAW